MVNDRQMTWDELAEENSNLKAEKAVLQNALDSYGELKDMTALQITTKIKDLTEKNKRLVEAIKLYGKHKPNPGKNCSVDSTGKIIKCECGLLESINKNG